MPNDKTVTANQRNLDPHAEAIAAMYLWGNEYSKQHGGSMDFWDGLSDFKKRLCRELVNKIKSGHRAND